jgi:hypothetical protein
VNGPQRPRPSPTLEHTLPKSSDKALGQLNELAAEYNQLAAQYKAQVYDQPAATRFVTRARAAIERLGGLASAYQTASLATFATNANSWWKAEQLAGVLDSLRADIAAGYLDSQRELIHGEMFQDFLEMAQHLLDGGFKDAAAVIAGSSLEVHLRQLCVKAKIDTHDERGEPKKSERLNADLTKAGVYSGQDQKSVTSWLGFRNDAAHGHYGEYTPGQIALMIGGVRDFMDRNPA